MRSSPAFALMTRLTTATPPITMATKAEQISSQLSPEDKYNLITRDLQEVLGGDKVKAILQAQERPVRAYFGTAPTGRPHVGYLMPLCKLADFLKAGVHLKVLLADIHAFLDNLKAPIELVKARAAYYGAIIKAVLQAIGVPVNRLEFVVGSSYQLTPQYTMDQYRLASIVTEHDALRAGAEVVKQVASPLLSSLLYPGLQALDEEHLHADFQFGGVDQRKIFTYAEAFLPKLGYEKRAHLMSPMVPGLKGSKMSASDKGSKIDFLESPKEIQKKLNEAFCVEGEVEENGVLAFAKAVLFPVARLRAETRAEGHADLLDPKNGAAGDLHLADSPEGTLFSINRPEKFGGPLHYASYAQVEADFVAKKLHPLDLKKGVADAITTLLEPVRKAFETPELAKLNAEAYPTEAPAKPAKKTVKAKNPRVAHMFTVEEGGTAKTKEEALAAQKADKEAKEQAKEQAQAAAKSQT